MRKDDDNFDETMANLLLRKAATHWCAIPGTYEMDSSHDMSDRNVPEQTIIMDLLGVALEHVIAVSRVTVSSMKIPSKNNIQKKSAVLILFFDVCDMMLNAKKSGKPEKSGDYEILQIGVTVLLRRFASQLLLVREEGCPGRNETVGNSENHDNNENNEITGNNENNEKDDKNDGVDKRKDDNQQTISDLVFSASPRLLYSLSRKYDTDEAVVMLRRGMSKWGLSSNGILNLELGLLLFQQVKNKNSLKNSMEIYESYERAKTALKSISTFLKYSKPEYEEILTLEIKKEKEIVAGIELSQAPFLYYQSAKLLHDLQLYKTRIDINNGIRNNQGGFGDEGNEVEVEVEGNEKDDEARTATRTQPGQHSSSYRQYLRSLHWHPQCMQEGKQEGELHFQ